MNAFTQRVITGFHLRDREEARDWSRPWFDPPGFLSPKTKSCCCGEPCSELGYYYYGLQGGTRVDAAYKYDSSDTYTSLAAGPSPARSGSVGTAISGKAYSFNGIDASINFLRDNEEYAPTGDSWTSKTDSPTPGRAHGGAGTIGNYGYTFYGQNTTTTHISDCDRYDPSGDSWTSKTNAPSPSRIDPRSGEISSKLCSCTGANTITSIRDSETYVEDTWTSETDSPTPARAGSCRGFPGGSGFAVTGGASGSSAIRDHDLMNPGSSWISKTDCPTPGRYFNMGFSLCGVGYSVGHFSGADNDSWIDDVWSSETDQPVQHSQAASCSI
ncbi:MAG: Kelch repeat-containing protein [Planctomycetaceae bacterium]